VISSGSGGFEFNHVAPGKYVLTAQHHGFALQAYLQHGAYATSIVVGPGLDSENIVFRLVPDASISGQITNELNDAVRDSQVLLFSQNADSGKRGVQQAQQSSTDDEGRYSFYHLRAGTYYVAISAQPWYAQFLSHNGSGSSGSSSGSDSAGDQETSLDLAYPVTFYPDATDSSRAEAIALKPGDQVEANIHLQPVPAVHIRVKNPDAGSSSAFRGFQVSVARTIFGSFSINVPVTMSGTSSGSVDLDGLAPGSYRLQYFARTGTETTSQTEELTTTGDREITIDQNVHGSMIAGVARIEGVQLLPDTVTVVVRDEQNGEITGAQLSVDGKFEFARKAFAAGRYAVLAGSASNLVVRSISANGARVLGENIVLDGTSDVSLVLVISRAVPVVDGIALRDGKPVAGAMVLLVPKDPANHPDLFRRDQTNTDGSFAFLGVVPGKYTVVALEDAWNLEFANPSVIGQYLAGGTTVDAETEGQYNLLVTVQ
jgi:uncharacterized protein (DUF2141 family)